jgi:crotonobetainyl-CoA:carnitine CoA-transferase CaiB-like acyl-CoA transferase
LQKIIEQKAAKYWLKIFESFELPINLVALVEESKNDPQVLQNQMVVAPKDDRIKTPLIIEHPIQISNVEKVGPTCAPGLGEHTDEVLADLGYTVEEVTRLRESGVI